MDECRKQFEDWVTVSGEFPKAAERSKDGGYYKLMQTHIVWSGWEAAWNRAAQQWQPIETAPKDGTKFLGFKNGYIAECYRVPRDDCEMWCIGTTSAALEHFPDHKPTHWMPLPTPPGKGE